MELRYASQEVRDFRKTCKHAHSYGGGTVEVWGDGAKVLRVAAPSIRNPGGVACLLGPDGLNEWGEPFAYSDYFLPEELARAA